VPAADAEGWSAAVPTSYTLPNNTDDGPVTVYAWVKDNDGNVSPNPGARRILLQRNTPRTIRGPQVSVTYFQAAVTWTTNVETLGKVRFGETADLEKSTPYETAVKTDHSFTLDIPFKPGVTYHGRVINGVHDGPLFTFVSPEWGNVMGPALHVDAGTAVPPGNQDGSEAAPFSTINAALDSIGQKDSNLVLQSQSTVNTQQHPLRFGSYVWLIRFKRTFPAGPRLGRDAGRTTAPTPLVADLELPILMLLRAKRPVGDPRWLVTGQDRASGTLSCSVFFSLPIGGPSENDAEP